MIPTQLNQFKPLIQNQKPEFQLIDYHAEYWRNYFPQNKELESVIALCPEKISRGNLFQFAKEAIDTKSISDIQRLFLASMIWGYGTTNYGPWRTEKMFSSPNVHGILKRSFELVLDNKIIEAYSGFNLNRCGPPFFTKFFYFIGYGAGLNEYPLILDTRVWEALRDRFQIDTAPFVKPSTWWYPEGYIRYIRTMHNWAKDLNCEAHNIELALFSLGGIKK
jgi:hypothetical protein